MTAVAGHRHLDHRDRDMVESGRLDVSRPAAIDPHINAVGVTNRNRVGVQILERRRRPPFARWQHQPQLQQPYLALRGDILAVNDAAPGRHPLHFPCVERAALVAIVNRPVENQA